MQQPTAPMPQRAKPTLLEAIAAASSGFGELIKDTKNTFTNSPYQKLPALLRAIKPALLEQCVVIYTQVVAVDSAWVVRTTLAFADGTEELSSDFPIPDYTGIETVTKNGSLVRSPGPAARDQIGATMTYGTRYNLYALLAVCPEEDDDGASANTYSAAQGLPGLPGGVAWPAPGQQAQAPRAMYQQAAPMPPAMVNPVQPFPVLPQ
jgi:hypothetical protein